MHDSKPIGWPNRDAAFDVYPGFVNPPQGYGEVAFYWWVGEKLTKERLLWQLDKLKDHPITGLQINYAHSDEGGDSYGLSLPSDPPLFSEDWWELFAWFAEKCGEAGMTVSLSDYTLCTPGQGWYTDEILAHHPDLSGAILKHSEWVVANGDIDVTLPENLLSVVAYPINEQALDSANRKDLNGLQQEDRLRTRLPDGDWKIVAVYYEERLRSLDPMHPLAGAKAIAYFFQRFEERLAKIPNAKLGFFFSDELEFGLHGLLWNKDFREAFKSMKGYDLLPELAGLFTDIGSRTPKIRLDYKDVMVALSEAHYFIPVFNWHQERGMIYGCDHGGRGKDVTEFGDYFRTQRWNQGPGCDQPYLECDLIKNKVASSIAHLYNRPRTWLEGYHSSGWGTNTEQLTDATFRNFASGHNLLSLHGLYYTTLGGWWEWAPPCNHFRMPYWPHMKNFLACSERLSYLLSQGVHVCDVALLYPVASMEAGMNGDAAVQTAFALGEHLYKQGIDFDFIDFESVDRAAIADKELRVAGEAYRVLILPDMAAIRYSTLLQALDFYKAGGIVIAVGSLPLASDAAGSADGELNEIVLELFGIPAELALDTHLQTNAAGGRTAFTVGYEETAAIITNAFPRDFVCLSTYAETEFPYMMHRKIGDRDLYMVYGAPQGGACFFRCHGSIELWNPWDGSVTEIDAHAVTSEGTTILLPLERNAVHLIVFRSTTDSAVEQEDINRLKAVYPLASKERETLDGYWAFELQPTMNNRFGDFRLPATDEVIGAEARQFRYMPEADSNPGWESPSFDDADWRKTTYGYGPYFFKLGPIPSALCSEELDRWAANLTCVNLNDAVQLGGRTFHWQPYEFSRRFGVEGDPGHQGYHGLKGKVTDQFIALGKPFIDQTETVYSVEEAGEVYYLWSTFDAGGEESAKLKLGGNLPANLWLNGDSVNVNESTLTVQHSHNYVVLRYDNPGRSFVVFESERASVDWEQTYPLAMNWYNKPGLFAYNVDPEAHCLAGWYRFTAPPGLASMEITAFGRIDAWVDGVAQDIVIRKQNGDGSISYRVALPASSDCISLVALRIAYSSSNYAGAAFPEPIRLQCAKGLIQLGDWSLVDGLNSYSGGAIYRISYAWRAAQSPSGSQVLLDLGRVVSSAEIRINGTLAATLISPPWKLDISRWLNRGDNTIEILVYNTLANHYTTIPTRYRGDLASGLIGPVVIEVADR